MDKAVIILAFIIQFVSSADWGYVNPIGPSNWTALNYPICGQSSQSPIDIPLTANYDGNLAPFKLTGFNTPSSYTLSLVNNGHTAQVNINGNLDVNGGNLPNRFITAQFHFHWGSNDAQGSEHTTDGQAYPMEMHIVNYNEVYGSLSAAADKVGNGLAVLGFYFEVSSTTNDALTPLISKLQDIKYKDADATITGLNIQSMLPTTLSNYYRYSGSLTTPKCYQSVIWSVFDDKISISAAQLAEFRKLTESASSDPVKHNIVDNFRPVQPLNGRTVTKSFKSSAAQFTVSSFYHITFVVCMLFVYY